jgi:hypothetical protein
VIGLQITTILVPEIGLIYCLFWLRKNMKINVDWVTTLNIFLSTSIGYIISKLIMSMIVMNFIFELLMGSCILFSTYLLSLLLTGTLTKKNLNDIKELVNKNNYLRDIVNPFINTLITIAKDNG